MGIINTVLGVRQIQIKHHLENCTMYVIVLTKINV